MKTFVAISVRLLIFSCLAFGVNTVGFAVDWRPVSAPLVTPWTSQVDPAKPLPEHPRPDFQRAAWLSLNGLWDYALEPVDFKPMQGFIDRESMTTGAAPESFAGKILVPFAIDAPLSGIMHVLRPQERLWYRRQFEVPTNWKGQRVLLHVEASDWETGVYVNGQRVGQHRGGYDPFQFDITDTLRAGTNSLLVCVWDGTEQHCQPLGKQIMPENRQGFRYQPTGGIWQTVWLEAVPVTNVKSWQVTLRTNGFDFIAQLSRPSPGCRFNVRLQGQSPVTVTCGDSATIRGSVNIPKPRLWSPDSPYLYDVTLELNGDGKVMDSVASYVGLRTFTRNADGRLMLNGQPAPVLFGPLDQGYWPDGILTPPHEDAIKFDLEYLKSIGCNMVRVHIKTQPARWYYHADRLGLLVWQDMICTPKYGQTVDKAGSENWRREFQEIMNDFHNHPSIVTWVVFNEAWGQHDTRATAEWAARTDPSRVIVSTSGWTDHGAGDVLDVHDYAFYPSAPIADGFGNHRALTFGEVGGHNLLLPGKKWHPDQTQPIGPPLERAGGRMNFNSSEDLAAKYPFYIRNLRHFAQRAGYQAFVYTQITDVEHECNGWLTYDRKVSKLPVKTLRQIHGSLAQKLDYTELVGEGQWFAMPAGPVRKRAANASPTWAASDASVTGLKVVNLPHSGAPLVADTDKAAALGLRRDFTLSARPKRAVIEIRATHRDAFGPPPPERLDGHAPLVREDVSCVTFLDGRLHRTFRVGSQRGRGGAVAYLELTDAEIASLLPGQHTLAIEILNPKATVGLDVRLLSYSD